MDPYGWIFRNAVYPTWETWVRDRPIPEVQRYLDATQWFTLPQLETIQVGLMRRLLRHAYAHTPHYRALFDAHGLTPADIVHTADLSRLPVLEKSLAQASVDARRSKVPPFPIVEKKTSGTSGQPMTIAYNQESRIWREATRLRGYGWAHYRVGDRTLHFWGAPPSTSYTKWSKLKIGVDHWFKRDRYVDVARRADEDLRRAVAELVEFKPRIIVAYSQGAAALARFVNAGKLRTWPDVPVICGAERLLPGDRESMQAAFGPIFETYGCREVMLIGSECDQHDGLHTSMENLIVEIIVRDPHAPGGTRAAKPGETGEVVLTDLHNIANPLIRYANGDLATAMTATQCACGRWLKRLAGVQGRVTETLFAKDGTPVSGMVFAIFFGELGAHFHQFQVVQHASRDITMRVVLRPSTDAVPERAVMIAKEYFGKYLPGSELRFDIVDDIPLTSMGKRLLVHVEVTS